jgi:hypothetical protein
LIVRRIEKNQIEGVGGSGRQPALHGSLKDREVIAEGLQVVTKGFCGTVILLKKKSGFGPAAQGLKSVGSGAGKEIQNAGIGNPVGQGGENGRANTVLGRAKS